jgi:hypothetical protein
MFFSQYIYQIFINILDNFRFILGILGLKIYSFDVAIVFVTVRNCSESFAAVRARSEVALGLYWLVNLIWFVLPVLPYFGRPNQKTNPDLNSFFPPSPLQPNTMPK